jgi:hypothetical protein
MVRVAESMGVGVHCPREGRFSLFNSPYPGHRLKSGIDVYPSLGFGGDAPSPVEGDVLKVRRVKAPRGRGFADAGYDVVTLLRPVDNPGVVVKILHVDTRLSVGDHVELGDCLGTLLRSGYYGWGTSPHIHLEVREPQDPLRARGGHAIHVLHGFADAEPVTEIAGEVVWTQPEYALVRLGTRGAGLTGELGGEPGVVDGGIPYYGWLGFHTERPTLGAVRLLGSPIADVKEVKDRAAVADTRVFSFTLDGEPLLGLSLYLTPRPGPIVKVLPRKIGGLSLSPGDEAAVELRV